MTRLLASLLALALAASPASAQEDGEDKPEVTFEDKSGSAGWQDTDLVDQPTATVLEYGSMGLRGRFSSVGGVVTDLTVGVFQRFNVGAAMTVDRLIGTADPIRLRAPTVRIKYRFYDGSRLIPAFAVGFDGQGHFYDGSRRRYNEDKRGLYVVGSHEVFFPNLMFHPGFNISDFDTNSIFFFSGLSLDIEEKLLLMVEWDNIRRINESRLNAAIRFRVTPAFELTFAVREIGGTGPFPDGSEHANERVVQMRYVGSF